MARFSALNLLAVDKHIIVDYRDTFHFDIGVDCSGGIARRASGTYADRRVAAFSLSHVYANARYIHRNLPENMIGTNDQYSETENRDWGKSFHFCIELGFS